MADGSVNGRAPGLLEMLSGCQRALTPWAWCQVGTLPSRPLLFTRWAVNLGMSVFPESALDTSFSSL